MNHIFINEQNIHQLMERLLASEPIQSGRYQIFQDVPVQVLEYTAPFFCRRKNLATMDCSTAMQSIDYLICTGEAPVLALTFDIDPKESKALFHTVLYGLPHYSVHLLSFLAMDIDDTLWQILQELSDLEQEAQPVCPYILRYVPMETDYPHPSFIEKRFVSADGNTTAYGRSCGLLFRLTSQGKLPCIACKVPGSPLWGDNHTVDAQTASALQALLDAPVADFLPHESSQLTLSQYLALASRSDCGQGLRTVAKGLCDPCSVQHFAILQMPLRCYFEACAALTGIHYPLWKYTHDVLPFLNPSLPEDSFTLAAALQNALTEDARPSLAELLSAAAPVPGAGRI